MSKSAREIRTEFLEFFKERGHQEVPSAPVFPQDDPTLLFTNAGMNQFKDVFLGTGSRDYARAVDTQKCIRVSGKHNDLEEVGVDTYHHTFFEMLGNWSFGDYFKADTIGWAWELLTGVWKLPKERLWVTVFGGDETDGLSADEEAERLWRDSTDIDPEHVLRFDRADNFWEMGDTGPCGPCSEIHFDRGEAKSDPSDGADPKIGVNAGNERFIELWNLVFMEFNRLDDGSLKPLPAKHVDTGMGFERIAAVLQDKRSNYDTDVFSPIFRRTEELVGTGYGGGGGESDVAFRVIADHVRAVSSAFADGALPSNLGRGYVLRRLIRRASRYGRQALGIEKPFLFDIVPAVAETLGPVFPEIAERIDHVQLLIRTEEESFRRTLDRGLRLFGHEAERRSTGGSDSLPGETAYELYSTYGFPRDLTELMARERGMSVDPEGWERAEREHQTASKAEGSFRSQISAEAVEGLAETVSTYHEEGARAAELETEVLRVVPDGEDGVLLALKESPFYPESGGQIGDVGTITALDGSFVVRVASTQKTGGIVWHQGPVDGVNDAAGKGVRAAVDAARRDDTRRNHTATHLLHKALKEVLGDHVAQQGSYVGPDRLRFDFSHPKGLGPEEIEEVEARVNRHVFRNETVRTTLEDLEQAKSRGVMALFGEKYDQRVRVVEVGDWSAELCGGTHVAAAGDIGPFVIASEGAIQAGVRRIEALTGRAAVEWIQHQRRVLQEASRTLKSSPESLVERVGQLQTQLKEARKKASVSDRADVTQALESVESELAELDGIRVGLVEVALPQAGLRELATRLKGKHADLAVVLMGQEQGRVPWIVLSQGAAQERGFDARRVAGFLREHLGGGGGGKSELAQGQGQNEAGRAPAKQAFLMAPQRIFAG